MLRISVSQDDETKALLKRIATSLERIELWLRPTLAVPGQVFISRKRQVTMTQFGYTFALPTPANPADVARRALVIATNGGTATEYDVVNPAATTSAEFIFDVDSTVQVVVKDFDAAGNFALGPAFDFTVNDDVPPDVPGAVVVMEKRQL